MDSPDKFRRMATRERELAEKARTELVQHLARAELWDRTAAELERLHSSDQHTTVGHMDSQSHGLAVSKGKSRGQGDALVEACNAKDLTLRSLATRVGLKSHTLLSMARRGERPIKKSLATAIEREVGFPATAANWPGGFTDS